ncbi:MAG: hypothetical protein ACRDXB_14630 [Actinomycetes bacterium]
MLGVVGTEPSGTKMRPRNVELTKIDRYPGEERQRPPSGGVKLSGL